MDDEGVGWLTRRLGYREIESQLNDESPTGRTRRVGLLTSKTGPGAIFAGACENLARMCVEEINLDGGLGGIPVELLVGDDGTDAIAGVSEARRLIDAGMEKATRLLAELIADDHAVRTCGLRVSEAALQRLSDVTDSAGLSDRASRLRAKATTRDLAGKRPLTR